jgi:hypothetical protein
MSGLVTEKTAAQIAAEMKQRGQSGSPVVETLASAGKLAGIEYESGGEEDGKPVPEFGAKPIFGHKSKKVVTQPRENIPQKVATTVARKVDGGGEEEGRNKEGGVLHWLGLAGGRKRRRKKSRKKKKKSKSKKRRRKSRRKKRRKSKRKKSRRRRKKSRRRRR